MASGEEGALITIPLLTVVSEGPDVGRQYRLGDETTIGRQLHAEIRLDDETVSRNHTRVQRQAHQWTVEDLSRDLLGRPAHQ